MNKYFTDKELEDIKMLGLAFGENSVCLLKATDLKEHKDVTLICIVVSDPENEGTMVLPVARLLEESEAIKRYKPDLPEDEYETLTTEFDPFDISKDDSDEDDDSGDSGGGQVWH